MVIVLLFLLLLVKVAVCPPLSLNALMEYKPLITANGHGEFKHGKPTFFRP